MSGATTTSDDLPELDLDTGIVCRLIELARPALAREEVEALDESDVDSNLAFAAVHEGEGDDPLKEQLIRAIDALNQEQQERLLALFWIGRGDFDVDEFTEALSLAADRWEDQASVAATLLGSPLLGEHLEAGLEAFGRDCSGEGVPSEDTAEGGTVSSVTSDAAFERLEPAERIAK